MKQNRKELVLTTLVCLLPILAGLAVYDRLPARIATHFGFHGEPDGWSSRPFAVFALPLLMAGINLLLCFGLEADPKKENMNGTLRTIVLWIVPVLSVLVSALVLGTALGYPMHIEVVIPLLVGLLFIAIGSYLPKTGQSCTMGFKLPWTLASEENWNRTHRLAGFLWVLGGAAMVVITLLGAWTLGLYLALILALALVPSFYSYSLYKKGI